jgi:hypothetical protein
MYNSEYLCIDKNNKAHEIAKNIVSHLYKYESKIKEKDILFFSHLIRFFMLATHLETAVKPSRRPC